MMNMTLSYEESEQLHPDGKCKQKQGKMCSE